MRFQIIRALLLGLLRLCFRLRIEGAAHVAEAGPRCIIMLNHVSFLDPLVAYVLAEDEPVFAIDGIMAGLWWVKPVLRFADAHCIDPFHPFGMRGLIAAARAGRTVIIFPEGRLSVTGGLMKVYPGAAYLALKAGAAVLPVQLRGLEETALTRLRPGLLPRRLFPVLSVRVGEPLPPPMLSGGDRLERDMVRRMQEAALEALDAHRHAQGSDLWAAFLARAGEPGAERGIVEDQPIEGGWPLRRLKRMADAEARRIAVILPRHDRLGVPLKDDCASIVRLLGCLATGRTAAVFDATSAPGGHMHARGPCSERPGAGRDAARPAWIGADGAPTHRDVLADVGLLSARLPLTRQDKVFCALEPHCHGALAAGIFWPLLSGAKIYLARGVRQPRLVADCIYIANVTVLIGDDPGLETLAAAADPYDFHAVRRVLAWGGAAPRTASLFAEKFGLGVIAVATDPCGRPLGLHGPGLRRSDGATQPMAPAAGSPAYVA